MSLGQHEHRVVLRWRLQPLIPDQLLQRLSRRRSNGIGVDPDRNDVSWCGWHSTLHNNDIWVHWHGSWWRLRGLDLVFHHYLEKDHW
jgi:hypothetical protein